MSLDRDRLAELDPVQANVMVIVQALLEHQRTPGEAVPTLEPGLSAEACIVAAAALIEVGFQEGVEEQAVQRAEKMIGYVRRFREERSATGLNALEQLGAIVTSHRVQ
jgi:hypothetical protein